ncbi:TetR/AcrR family transcriptional regulator [Microbacterium sp. NPDC077184]|uniref:TetR/AcrR family transcriptional regulator n=1 Tax=Microbacterium sp. NPDC077184 TaxID=3154764 RepID=UPI00341243AE
MPAPLRSPARLHTAILDLARERAPEQLTATEIARHAGVHRSTFYEHADTPASLLVDALRADLDGIRHRYLDDPDVDVDDAVVVTTRAVLAHIERFEPIYQRGLRSPEGSVRALLSTHFRDSLRMLEDAGRVTSPVTATGHDGAFGLEATARFIAGGAVGLLEAWLAEPPPRAPELYLDAFASLTAASIIAPRPIDHS